MIDQPLTLTMDAAMILADRTRNDAADEKHPIGKRLILKLAAAYLELVGDTVTTATTTIRVTEPEVWYLRSLVNSGDRTDRDSKFGIHVLRQLYEILLAFDTADATGAVRDAGESCRDRRWQDEDGAKYVGKDDADLDRGDWLAGAA